MAALAVFITHAALGILVAAWLFIIGWCLQDMARGAVAWCDAKGLPHPIVVAWRILLVPAWLALLAVHWSVLRLLHVLVCLMTLLTHGRACAIMSWRDGPNGWI